MNDWVELVRQKKFAEAEKLMLDDTAKEVHGYEIVTRANFYENWGDAEESVSERKTHYEKSLDAYRIFASWSTSGGEGTVRWRTLTD